ncbi:MAG: hypothetical protein L6V93_06410 [Clostridiales bacterium]|nr:MAG: hypothetical protein L6V93_06410 [Clostridiales bacterium]
MKYRYAKRRKALKITGIYASVFLFLTVFLILNFPALHFNFDIQKSALSSAVVNMPKSDGSVAVKSAAAAVKIHLRKIFFSQKKFFCATLFRISRRKTPEIKVTDTPPSAPKENEKYGAESEYQRNKKMVSKKICR